MKASGAHFHQSDSTIGSWIVALVGLGMTVGFAALFVSSELDRRAFPAEPRATTVAVAAAMRDPARGSWGNSL